MRPKSLCVRNMTEADLALALEWAAAEGWNPGPHDVHRPRRLSVAQPESSDKSRFQLCCFLIAEGGQNRCGSAKSQLWSF